MLARLDRRGGCVAEMQIPTFLSFDGLSIAIRHHNQIGLVLGLSDPGRDGDQFEIVAVL